MGKQTKTNAKRPWYKEGDWFAVPLKEGEYVPGLIARGSRKTVLFGYFFGPIRKELPTLDDVRQYRAEDAILMKQFGDLGLYEGEWPLIGRVEPWDRAAWPMPPFSMIDDIFPGVAYKRWYSEEDPAEMIKQVRCDPEEAKLYPKDSMLGDVAVQIVLRKLLLS